MSPASLREISVSASEVEFELRAEDVFGVGEDGGVADAAERAAQAEDLNLYAQAGECLAEF